jgi:hypothetical protein
MTSREALAILTAPRFGDPKCIEAVKHLTDVEDAREAFGKRRHKKYGLCKGSGMWDEQEFRRGMEHVD